MSLARKKQEHYTYADYLTWGESYRCELIDGVVYDMTPAPSRQHQELAMELSGILWSFFKDHPCKVFPAPFDVRLPSPGEDDDRTDTVVQPDIVVVCDARKLDDRGCRGAPDLAVEIVSPESAARDMKEKLALYEKRGVKEYWVVHPDAKIVMVFYRVKKNTYGKPLVFGADDIIRSKIFRDLKIKGSRLFGVK
ncbi:MAG: Uma2 family endonuclease [Spirochaetes bacterium]|nr:Uma2 family endonuclease [Spirochaetota bacterium]